MNVLHKKLKLKPHTNLLLLHAPTGIISLLEPLPDGCTLSETPRGKHDMVMLFVQNTSELELYYMQAVHAARNDGILWFCYPKGSSKIQTDLTRDHGWDVVMALNYQWLSLISLNDTWSAFAIKVGKIAPPPAIGVIKENLVDADGAVLINYETREIKTPKLFKQLLKGDPDSLNYFESLSFTNKKEYLLYIYEAKKEETRMARIGKAMQMLRDRRKTPAEKG